MKLENVFRRIHPNATNQFHGRSPLSEISNDLTLAHPCRRWPSTPTNHLPHLWRTAIQLACELSGWVW